MTGGAGFIGSSLCELLLSLGFRVRVLDNLSTGDAAFVRMGAEFVNGDVRDYDAVLAATRGARFVFHLAAMSKVEPSLSDPEMVRFCLDVNVGGTENVMRAALAASKELKNGTAPARVVYAASSTHYGSQPVPFTESRPSCSPALTRTQALGRAVRAPVRRALHGVPTTSLRLFMVYDERQAEAGRVRRRHRNVLRRLENGEPVTIRGRRLAFPGLRARSSRCVARSCWRRRRTPRARRRR